MTKELGNSCNSVSTNVQNRVAALEEVQMLLRSRNIDLTCLFDLLFKCDDGCLDFNVGDIAIQFVHGFGVWSDRKDVIQMTVEVHDGPLGEAVGYEYGLDELRKLVGTNQLGSACRRME